MKSIKYIIVALICTSASISFAHINPKSIARTMQPVVQTNEVNFREDCQPATAQIDMDINNVRARLLTGGDVWWDLSSGKYIVPKPPIGSGLPEVSSIFAGGVWIGGEDPSGNLKIAASDYRGPNGGDYFSGPLDPETGLTDLPICNDWDRFFTITGEELAKAIQVFEVYEQMEMPIPCDSIPDNVKYWPGKDNPFFEEKYPFSLPEGQNLGSYWDQDLSGDYDPCKGDFPIIDIRGCEPTTRKEAVELVPDQMIFWIYNDAGGEHRLTRGEKIQMEVQVQAFAYATNDEVNDMTFQRYKLLNRAEEDIRNCYFAMWVDPDLGCFDDDFIGCDVGRSLAYTYNEDILDGTTGCNCGGTPTYCDNVPIIGTDYFRGPIGPYSIVDCAIGEQHVVTSADDIEGSGLMIGDTICVLPVDIGQDDAADLGIELGMSSFIYYNNPTIGSPDPNTVDPDIDFQYYNYLQGLWLDGTPMTQGGTGFNPGSVDETRYVFPDDPDTDGWNMCNVDLGNGDRRTLQASGPLLLKPSVENELIIGAVWVPDLTYPCPDISKLHRADDLAQALFDNCFDIIDGPTAPDVCPIALDREIVLVLSNDTVTSNNAYEGYFERDILAAEEIPDSLARYEFEGYKIFQLANSSVTPQELDDIEKARLVRQTDIKNGVAEIYNWRSQVDPNPASGQLIWTPEREVDGSDEGIRHTFRLLEDAFAPGDSRLVNHKEYHYMVIAYSHNNYETFDPANSIGQSKPYLEGRKNISTYTIVPRPIVYQNQNADYGDGAVITRESGIGVGGNFLDLDDSMYDKILDGSFNGEITYKEGAGPVTVKIYDPINVKDGNFTLELIGSHGTGDNCKLSTESTWRLVNEDNGDVVISEQSIATINEQLIPEYGFSLSIGQSDEPGDNIGDNGAIDVVSDYADPSGVAWYGGLTDDAVGLDLPPFLAPVLNFMKTSAGEMDNFMDREASYSQLGERTWYPFILADGTNDNPNVPFYLTPAWEPQQGFVRNFADLSGLNNVDVVFTSDKSKWSRCAVIEKASPVYASVGLEAQGGAGNFDLREAPSVDKNGNPDNTGTGMSWFPGYAVDVETGERLNIFFGENSVYGENFTEYIDGGNPIGADMMYNPTSQFVADAPTAGLGIFEPTNFIAGGQHVVYVTREKYDGCEKFADQVLNGSTISKVYAYTGVTWCSMSILPVGVSLPSYEAGGIPNDLIVKLRADNSYGKATTYDISAPDGCNTEGDNPKYRFKVTGKEATDIVAEEVDNALANVNVVPNPYYGFSQYEISQTAKTVKITNLPDEAIVSIFSLDGKFIRQFRRQEVISNKGGNNPGTVRSQTNPDIIWDLNNSTGIPIASGVYIIHVEAPTLGAEKTIKWFGVNRKFDPSGL